MSVRQFLGLLVAGSATVVVAAEGRFPIWEPVTIATSGRYVLTQDVTAGVGPVIDVVPGIGDVEIDLNGFTVSSSGAGTAVIQVNGANAVIIRNGSLQGGPAGLGVKVDGTLNVTLERLHVSNLGSDCLQVLNAGKVSIHHNTLEDCNGAGIRVDSSLVPDLATGSIESNRIQRAFAAVQVVGASSLTIRDNQIETTLGGDGVSVSNGNSILVSENVIQSAGGNGAFLRGVKGAKLYNNVISGAGLNGVWLAPPFDNAIVLHNVISGSGQAGLRNEGSFVQIDKNVVTRNNGFGVWLTPAAVQNTYGRNTMRGNSGLGPACGAAFAACLTPQLCDEGGGNVSFGDNVGPIPGC
jgi:hypothetical protein